jgi:cell division protein FtsW
MKNGARILEELFIAWPIGVEEGSLERLRHFDYTILIAALALVGIGIVMIYSASCIMAQQRYGDAFLFLKRQSLFALFGIFCMAVAMNMPYRWWRHLVYPLILLTVAALVLVLIPPFGRQVGGASRWLHIGGFNFQPSEAAKLVLVVYLAYSLSRKKERGTVHRFTTGLLPHVLFSGTLMIFVLKEPDLGTSIIMGVLAFVMMFLAGVPLRFLSLTMLAALPYIYYQIKGYQWERILVFLKYLFSPWNAPLQEAYHIKQSCFALANGGLFGQGLGMGNQKLFFLPEPHTDFIISVIGEEWGFLGILVVCFLFLVLLVSGARIALALRDPFGSLLAMGIVMLIGLQGMINMAMALGLLPTKGMALPFLSYGGSSLVVSLTAVGILIHLSSKAQQGERS